MKISTEQIKIMAEAAQREAEQDRKYLENIQKREEEERENRLRRLYREIGEGKFSTKK